MRSVSAIRAGFLRRRSDWVACASVLFTVSCSDPNSPAELVAFQEVSAGGHHTCAIAVSGAAYCWGRGEAGELGNLAYASSAVPHPVEAHVEFVTLSAGGRHTCALSAASTLHCWGWNLRGQLGNASTVDQAAPVTIASTLRFVSVSSGWLHTCGIAASGDAYCWGANEQGQLGDGTLVNRLAPVRVAGPRFTHVSAGGFHSCGITAAGTAYCWGLNHEGQLGTGTTLNAIAPVRVADAVVFRDIDAGFSHTCGIGEDAMGYCWGSNAHGELGVAFATEPGLPGATRPAMVHGGVMFSRIDAGLSYTCSLAVTRAFCWGRGFEGQLGNGGFTSWVTPQPVAEVTDFTSVSAGGDTHACGVTQSNAVFCWGRGQLGQLGNLTLHTSALPVRVRGAQ